MNFPRKCAAAGPETLRLGCGAIGEGFMGVEGTLLLSLPLNLNRNGVSGGVLEWVWSLRAATPRRFGSVLILTRGGDSCNDRVAERAAWPLSDPSGLSCELDDCELDSAIISRAALRL